MSRAPLKRLSGAYGVTCLSGLRLINVLGAGYAK